MKTVLLVPGFKENSQTHNYQNVLQAIESRGYRARLVSINWERTTLTDWVQQLDAEYTKHDPAKTILAGFSFGAVTALMSATKNNPAELWLFSLSPYFAEDISLLKVTWLRNIGLRRAAVFQSISFPQLAQQISCKTVIMIGEVEARKYPVLDNRCREAHRLIADSVLVVAKTADHDLTTPNYIKTIQNTI